MRQPARRRGEPPCKLEFAQAERVSVSGSVPLITIGPDHPIWRMEASESVVGAIVRMQPAADADPEAVFEAEAWVRAVALSVKVLPPASGPAAVVESAREQAATSPTIRVVVERMVQEARTGDRVLLAKVIEEALAHAAI